MDRSPEKKHTFVINPARPNWLAQALEARREGGEMVVSVESQLGDDVWDALAPMLKDQRWALTVGTRRRDRSTHMADLAWLARLPGPTRVTLRDPALHTLPGLDTLPNSVQTLEVLDIAGGLDVGALAAKCSSVRSLTIQAHRREVMINLPDLAPCGSLLRLVLQNCWLSASTRQALPVVDAEARLCSMEPGRAETVVFALAKVRRMAFDHCSADLCSVVERLPQLEVVDLRAMEHIRKVPKLDSPDVRVLRMSNLRALRDVSGLTQLDQLERFSINGCPRIDRWTVRVAPLADRLVRWAVGAGVNDGAAEKFTEQLPHATRGSAVDTALSA